MCEACKEEHDRKKASKARHHGARVRTVKTPLLKTQPVITPVDHVDFDVSPTPIVVASMPQLYTHAPVDPKRAFTLDDFQLPVQASATQPPVDLTGYIMPEVDYVGGAGNEPIGHDQSEEIELENYDFRPNH